MSDEWPTELPRFAESFRILIDLDERTRMLDGDWQHDAMFARSISDFCPRLAKAGKLGFIASTVPANYHGHIADWYGSPDYPTIYWHWRDTRWVAQATEATVADYCKRRKVPRALFDVPRSRPTH